MERSVIELEEAFYSKPFYLSYSGLNKLLYSPQFFYKHYILQQREERLDSHLIDGKVIHCMLLNNGSFDELFITSPSNLPTGNTRLVVDKIYDRVKEGPGLLGDYTVEITEILKEINLHQSLKTDQQRLDKIITDETKSYFEFLKRKGSKDIIDEETYKRCETSVLILKDNPAVLSLLGLDIESKDVFNEIPLQMKTHYEFGLKGIIDNARISYEDKIIYINDLKTSGKTLSDFKESIDYYKYWMQAAIYERLMRDFCKDKIDGSWRIQFSFIVIDKYQQVYAFPVSDGTMKSWQEQLDGKIEEARWHYTNRNYTLPYEFLKQQVYL